MMTLLQIQAEQFKARTRTELSNMREAALLYRAAIAPDRDKLLADRIADGAFHLKLAFTYRDIARRLGKWSPQAIKARLWADGGAED
jgi:hypothetical protein